MTVSGRLLHHTTATQSTKMYVGDSSANNTLNVSGSIRGDSLYVGGGAFGGNQVNVTGPGTEQFPTVHFEGGNNWIKIGVNSSYNSVNFSNGSYSLIDKGNGGTGFDIGDLDGADFNTLTVDGAGTTLSAYMGTYVGRGGDDNSLTVSNGAAYLKAQRFFVGETGSNNTALVTGDNSYFDVADNSNAKFGVGAACGATVGQSSGSPMMGVILANLDSTLTIDSGRLIGSLDGPLIAGLGQLVLDDSAYIRTDWTSQISSNIVGEGSLIKEGSGALTLSGTNSHGGDTTVDAGTLIIREGYLADVADVSLTTGAIFNLAFTGTIDKLFLEGLSQAIGTWGAPGSDADHTSNFFTGGGLLSVTTQAAVDAFPLDPVESMDTDGDGIGDNGDAGGIGLVGAPLDCPQYAKHAGHHHTGLRVAEIVCSDEKDRQPMRIGGGGAGICVSRVPR